MNLTDVRTGQVIADATGTRARVVAFDDTGLTLEFLNDDALAADGPTHVGFNEFPASGVDVVA